MMMMGRAVTPAEYTADQKREAQAIAEVERTVTNIQNYKRALEESPEMEMRSILNALAGGYVAPTSGGDAVANPQAVPTGRNLYAVNAETTPVRTGLGQRQGSWQRIRLHNTRKRTATIRAKSATPSGAVNSSRAKVRRSPRCSTCWA